MKEQFRVYTVHEDDTRKLTDFLNLLSSFGGTVYCQKKDRMLEFIITYDAQQFKQLNKKNPRNAGRHRKELCLAKAIELEKNNRMYSSDKARQLGVTDSTYYRHKRKLIKQYGSLKNAYDHGVRIF